MRVGCALGSPGRGSVRNPRFVFVVLAVFFGFRVFDCAVINLCADNWVGLCSVDSCVIGSC